MAGCFLSPLLTLRSHIAPARLLALWGGTHLTLGLHKMVEQTQQLVAPRRAGPSEGGCPEVQFC